MTLLQIGTKVMKIIVEIKVCGENENFCSPDCPQKASSHSCKLYGELDMYIVNYLRDKRCLENEMDEIYD